MGPQPAVSTRPRAEVLGVVIQRCRAHRNDRSLPKRVQLLGVITVGKAQAQLKRPV